MTRRETLGQTIGLFSAVHAFALPEQPPKLIRPRALKPGDTVGIVSPASQVSEPERLAMAQQTVDTLGLKAKWGKNVRAKHPYGAASIAERVEDLHAMFSDPEVKAIFCVRGGYSSGQLLNQLDYKLIARNPKIFAGFSDITALHLAIHKMTGLVTLHGPVLLSHFTPYTMECFKRALFNTAPLGQLTNPNDTDSRKFNHSSQTIASGKARGRLIGGNLTLISTTMGTPFEIETKDRIFFTEDVEEEPYRIDRMLTQLRLAGKLTQSAGIVFGECKGCRLKEKDPASWSVPLENVLNLELGNLKIPAFSGLTIGHTDNQLTLPIGVMATLDADRRELVIEESATA